MPIIETFMAGLAGAKATHKTIDTSVNVVNKRLVKPIRDEAREKVRELQETQEWVERWQKRLEKK